MDFEILVRYLIPGAIALAPLILLPLTGQEGMADALGALAAVAIPVGYLLHQVWHLIFHIRGGYVRVSGRQCLQYLRTQIALSVEDECVYMAWEFLLDKVEPEKRIRGQLKRLWQLYHGFMSSLLASVLGVILLITAYYLGGRPNAFLAVGIITYAIVLLTMQAQARYVGWEVSSRECLYAIDAAKTSQCALKKALDVYEQYRLQFPSSRRSAILYTEGPTPPLP